MSGWSSIGVHVVPNSFAPDNQNIRVRLCKGCEDTGVQLDGNGEPVRWCGCPTGDALNEASVAAVLAGGHR